ncbi:MAG: hypothetical protein HKN40_11430 [Winogradskyella sp.]|uniref:TolB family protein n=1 Tax=Winogradskyella sp. TaxID=1883156 RepID=UPI0017E7DB01|nr:hypothetical protein [Winogradskyella sp.]
MKFLNFLLIFSLAFVLVSCNENGKTNKQSPPLETETSLESIQPVAKNLFSKFTNVRDFTISTDETEAYFSLQSPARELSVIMKIEKKNNVWQAPEIADFSGRFTDLEPFLSPDNLKLYFVSDRPVSEDSTDTKDMDIWYVERENRSSSWSEPKNIGPPISTEADEFYPAVASNGNLYYTTIRKELNSEDDILMSKWENSTYNEPKLLGDGVNTKGAEYNAYIAPDESYIIFGAWRRQDGLGSGDLYMSKYVNDEWTKAVNLGDKINSKDMEFCPFVNDGVLYFTSRRSTVKRNTEGFKTTEELLREINKYDNGASRIYKVNFSKHLPNLY